MINNLHILKSDSPDRIIKNSLLFLVVGILCSLTSISIIILKSDFYFFPLIILGIILLLISYRNDLLALCLIILLFIHTLEKSEAISKIEIIYSIYLYGYLFYWFVKKLLILKERVIIHYIDFLLLSFWVLGLLSLIITISDGGSFIKWLRELLNLSILLLYFPLKNIMINNRIRKIIMFSFLSMVTIIVLYNLSQYLSNIQNIKYLWQIISGRQHFGVNLFTASSIMTFGILISTKSKLYKILFSLIFILSFTALALTFSRGFWFGTIIGLLIIFLLSDRVSKTNFIISFSIIFLVTSLTLIIFKFEYIKYFIEAINIRFSTAKSGIQDISIAERFNEYNSVMKQIIDKPLVGSGIGATFKHYNIIDKISQVSSYTHNGYLYIIFKVGILGAIIFFSYYLFTIIEGIKHLKKSKKSEIDYSIIITSIAVLVAFLITALSSGIFAEKHALLSIALSTALIISFKNKS